MAGNVCGSSSYGAVPSVSATTKMGPVYETLESLGAALYDLSDAVSATEARFSQALNDCHSPVCDEAQEAPQSPLHASVIELRDRTKAITRRLYAIASRSTL